MVPCGRSLHHIFDHSLIASNFMERKHDSIQSNGYFSTMQSKHHPCMNAESLSMCTEGLGFESFIDVEHLEDEGDEQYVDDHHDDPCFDAIEKHAVSVSVTISEILSCELKRARMKGLMEFPPPISSIGLSGKPWTCLKSYRSNGRFILKEVRIPTQELLHAFREDGRLKLQFIQSDDKSLYEDDDGDDDEEDDDEHLKVDFEGDYGTTRKPEITITST
ncbi:protein FAF-like, chloroplastic [Bidens hawaiensis]|uniref:protein FAF-like, chloroplastic n=1 Tax=Bidens hawaiensis TaxID=980011 RepID=UPI00404B4BBB